MVLDGMAPANAGITLVIHCQQDWLSLLSQNLRCCGARVVITAQPVHTRFQQRLRLVVATIVFSVGITGETDMEIITHALIQNGYCVFGTGDSYESCLEDACNWLEPDDNEDNPYCGESYTPARIEVELLSDNNRNVDGKFQVITVADPYFDSYLNAQGGFRKTLDGWISE